MHYITARRALPDGIVPGYTRIGYAVRQALLWDPADLAVDLTGRVMAITGGNSGLGYATARQLAALHKLRQTASPPADYQRLWDECTRLAGHDRLALQAPGSKPKSAEAD